MQSPKYIRLQIMHFGKKRFEQNIVRGDVKTSLY